MKMKKMSKMKKKNKFLEDYQIKALVNLQNLKLEVF